MPSKGLALALAGLMTAAAPAQADEPVWPTERLERRAAERGPIRSRLEDALAVPARELTAHAVEAARAEAAGQSSSQGRSSSVRPLVWVLIGLASLFALCWKFASDFSKI
jgi:hypothetical protein